MNTNIPYDSSRPLMRLEKGDEVLITYRKRKFENEKDRKKYENVPDGTFTGVYEGNYSVSCEKYPELSGKYNYWCGDRWGTSAVLHAREKESGS